MSNQAEIAAGFESLRKLCDPRGHDLLDALEQLCLVEALALDVVVLSMPEIKPSNVVPLIRDYSTKVPCA